MNNTAVTLETALWQTWSIIDWFSGLLIDNMIDFCRSSQITSVQSDLMTFHFVRFIHILYSIVSFK